MTIVGENIRKLREKRHWSQEQLAGAAEVSNRTVQRAENGEPFSAETLQAIAGALNVDIAVLQCDPEAEAMKRALARFVVFPVRVIRHGHELALFCEVAATGYSIKGELDSAQRDLVSEFQQNLRDCGDIWPEIGPSARRETEKDMQIRLDELRDLGISVSAGRERVKWRFQGSPDVTELDIGMIVYSASGSEPLWAAWDSSQGLG